MRFFSFQRTPAYHGLISVLATAMQPREALHVKELFRVADAKLLDFCDKYRNEGKRSSCIGRH
jgi:hypothetical protein